MNHPPGGFAAAFNELFADIFGPQPPKPRLYRFGRVWWAKSPDGLSRHGHTPAEAYQCWRQEWRRRNPFNAEARSA